MMLPDVEDLQHNNHTDTGSINERIVNNHALRFITALPEVSSCFKYTTFITPKGVFQLNPEINQWICRINSEDFTSKYQSLNYLLQRANETTAQGGQSAYDDLTIEQLNKLEQVIRLHRGYTIIGYTINEEYYVRSINSTLKWVFCHNSQYPPLRQDYSRRLLEFINRPILNDATAALRFTAQTKILFNYFVSTYYQYSAGDDDDYQFYLHNDKWLLLGMGVLLVASLFILRCGFVDKTPVLSSMMRIRMIEQSVIGVASILTNYGPLFINNTMIEDGFFPILLLGAFLGYVMEEETVINIAEYTRTQFLINVVFLSLTAGSFFSLGMQGPITDVLFLYVTDSPSVNASFHQDVNLACYPAFGLMLLVSFTQYPYLPLRPQLCGKYGSNLINGICYTMLDNYALYSFIENIFQVFFSPGLYFSPQKPIAPTLFVGLQVLALIAVFLVAFPNVPDLPEYSLEKNPIKPTVFNKLNNFFNKTKDPSKEMRTQTKTTHVTNEDNVEIVVKPPKKIIPFKFNLFLYGDSTNKVSAAPAIVVENPLLQQHPGSKS
jgi:hypothetical protein